MRVAMVTSECEPFAKTGGLADVVDALSRALSELGHDVEVFLPRYRGIEPLPGSRRDTVPVGRDVTLWTGDADGYRLRLVDHAPSFDRAAFYGEDGADYPDNGARFALLGRAALTTLAYEEPLDILHGHDWEAGPALLALAFDRRHGGVMDTASVLTFHNLAYHGWVPRERAAPLDLPPDVGKPDGVDILRESARVVDLANTVSPTYARESLTPEYGAGMDEVLRSLGDRYIGIPNGIDTEVWDPATDAVLAARYSRDDLTGKHACRADLASRHGLDASGPILGVVGRLDPQKGFDLVAGAAPALVEQGASLVVLGTGDATLLSELRAFAARRPDRVAVLERFDRDEARRIYAGADVFLMPSRFEPSGQGQLIALRYGTVPLVRRTGGLADTVFDADADPLRGNGFVFDKATPDALVGAARRAFERYRDAASWRELTLRGMAEDHGWSRPARDYEAAYQRAMEIGRERAGAS